MKVALFVPCYVDAFFPEVGIATLELLERLGCEVDFPLDQTCCGQPMANAGAADVNPWAMAAQGAAAGFSGGAGVGLSAQQYMQSRPQQQPDYGTPLQPSPMQYSIFGR